MILYRHCLLIFEFTIVTLFAVFTLALFPLGYSKGNIMRHCRSDTHQPDGSNLGVCGINFVCPDGSHLGVCGINFVCHHCYPLPAMRHPNLGNQRSCGANIFWFCLSYLLNLQILSDFITIINECNTIMFEIYRKLILGHCVLSLILSCNCDSTLIFRVCDFILTF